MASHVVKKIYKYSENGKLRIVIATEKAYTSIPHVKVDFMLLHSEKQ